MSDSPLDDAALPAAGEAHTHFVYMARCADGSLYTGYSTDVTRRVDAHNAGRGGRYTRSHRPIELLATWEFETKSAALRTERAIKRLERGQKLKLVRDTLIPDPSPSRGEE